MGRPPCATLARRVSIVPPPHPGEPWTREQIESMLRQVVRDSAGVEDFGLDDRFVRDMGID